MRKLCEGNCLKHYYGVNLGGENPLAFFHTHLEAMRFVEVEQLDSEIYELHFPPNISDFEDFVNRLAEEYNP